MNSIYDALNDAQVNPEDYDTEPLSALEKKAIKREFRRRSGISRRAKSVRWAAAAACLVCLIGFSQTAYAQAAISDILQSINLGHNTVLQTNPSTESKKPDLSGYYDKNGKPLTSANPNGETDLYDSKGNKVGTISKSKSGEDEASDPDVAVVKDLNKAVSQLSFSALLPKELPKGYAFERADFYKDDAGKIMNDCASFIYRNGSSQIYIQERKITDKATYTTATNGSLKKVTINSHTAALSDGQNLDWEAGGVAVAMRTQGLSTDQLIKLAQSMK